MKILHLCTLDKFIPPFIAFTRKHFDDSAHSFIVCGDRDRYPYISGADTIHLPDYTRALSILIKLNQSDKIILHNFANWKIAILLFLQPWLLTRCYWVIWGADLYYSLAPKNRILSIVYWNVRAWAIRRFAGIVTYLKDDYDLACKTYRTNAKYFECLTYESNLYKEPATGTEQSTTSNILVGNSADPSNCHEAILEKLLSCKEEDIRIICPLSYGDQVHKNKIIDLGRKLFGDKFAPLVSLMPVSEYQNLLQTVDFAVFAHHRQQAMGNTISLLGYGKTVYLRKGTPQWNLFSALGVRVFDFDELDLHTASPEDIKANNKIIKEYFSEEKLLRQLNIIYSE